jgi:hypothetical protein
MKKAVVIVLIGLKRDKHLNSDIGYIREDVINCGFVAQATAFILGIAVGMVIVWQLF